MLIIRKIVGLRDKPFLLILNAIFEIIPFNPIKLMIYHSFVLNKEIKDKSCKTLKVRYIEKRDIESINISDEKKALFYKRFRSGEICLIAQVGSIIAGYEWFTTEGDHVEERYNFLLDIPDAALYAYDAYIMPEFREKGIWKCIIKKAIKLLKENNKSLIISNIDYGNDISEIAHQKLGFVKERPYVYVSVLGISHLFKLSKASYDEAK